MKIDHKESFKEFGDQFLFYTNIDEKDYWGGLDIFIDQLRPFDPKKVKNKTIMEVGIGNGRVLKHLLKFHPKKIFAVDPANSIKIAKENKTRDWNISDLEKIIKKLKTNKASDPSGLINELFKAAGEDLKQAIVHPGVLSVDLVDLDGELYFSQ